MQIYTVMSQTRSALIYCTVVVVLAILQELLDDHRMDSIVHCCFSAQIADHCSSLFQCQVRTRSSTFIFNVSRELQFRQAPAGGKEIESDKQSTISSLAVYRNAKPQRKSSMDKDFELPPVVLLKPGVRFDVTHAGSRRFILDPDELAIY